MLEEHLPLLPPMLGYQPIANLMTHADSPDRSGARTWCVPGEYSSGPTELEGAANQTKKRGSFMKETRPSHAPQARRLTAATTPPPWVLIRTCGAPG